MVILDNNHFDGIKKDDIEQVQQEKQEYYFLGSYIRTSGLKLYAFDSMKDELYELNIKYSNTIHLVPMDGRLVPIDMEAAKCTIDSRHEVFEALNIESAQKRLHRYKSGRIDTLSNLRKPNPNALKLSFF